MRKLKQCRSLKSLMAVIMLLTMAVTLCACASETESNKPSYSMKVEEQTKEFYVNDFAKLFTEAEKQSMITSAKELDEKWGGIQIVVTTVKSLNGASSQQYATSMYNQYGIGEDSMGVLILLSTGKGPGDRDIRIETGDKMQMYLTDGYSGTELIDNIGMSYFENDDLSGGVIAIQEATISFVKENIPADWNSGKKQEDSKVENADVESGENSATLTENTTSKPINIFFNIIMGVALVLVLGFCIWEAIKKKKLEASNKKHIEEYKQELDRQKSKNNSQVQVITDLKNFHASEMEKVTAKSREQFNVMQQTLQRKIDDCNQKYEELERKHQQLSILYSTVCDKLERIQTLHPEINLETEVSRMIEGEYRQKAEETDKILSQYFDVEANMYKIGFFLSALQIAAELSPEVRKYLKSDINELQRRYQTSITLKDNYDKEQKEIADRKKAQEVYEKMKSVYTNVCNSVEYSDFEVMQRTNSLYQALSTDQKKYFPDSEFLKRFNVHYGKIVEEHNAYVKAKDAENNAEREIRGIYTADEDDISKIRRAFDYYNSLSYSEQKYFSPELLDKMHRFKREADDDHDRRERRRREERRRRDEERRRQSMSSSTHHSSSSFRSSSSFGHGGHSTGGGAGRRF